MHKKSKIYIAGHRGLVGSAIKRKLEEAGYENILVRSSRELDLRNQEAVNFFFEYEKPEYVFLAAAKVGGILANNTYRADFIYDNLLIQSNIIHASYQNRVKKLLFLGSSCIYPKLSPQPIKEEYLLTAPLEPTNEPYAIAKIAGIKMCEAYRLQYACDFISAMPTNLYGPNDNYDLQNSHVLPALIRKFHEAKRNNNSEVVIWGSGQVRREFLYVDDLAEACYLLMQEYSHEMPINVGSGFDLTIEELALSIQKIVGFTGELVFDRSKPDGTPQKLLDISRLKNLGFEPKISLEEGLQKAYADYLQKELSSVN